MEIMVAIGIMALVAGGAMMSMRALGGNRLRSASFSIAGAIKESYDRAIMEKRIQRLTFDLDNHIWWAEFTDDRYTLNPEDDTDHLFDIDDLDEDTPAEVRAALAGEKAAKFNPDPYMGKKVKLPADVHFARAWTAMSEDPFQKGLVHIHFFRGGFTEPLQLELYDGPRDGRETDREYMTVKVRPLTGRVKIYNRRLDKPEIKRPWEEDN